MINAGLAIDLPHIEDTGSAGIGLFRTELQFMVGQSLPRTSDQLALYRTVLDAAGTKPVTFRTLDIGGDKALPYMETVIEENPALGWRAIRLGLDRPGLLRGQIRALLRAGGGRALRIMFPMISEVAEFDSAKALVERELTYLRQHGHTLPERIDIGTMVEVPALLYQLDELLKKVDFISVGSNDLFQFLFAVDRGNAKVSERFDTMSAPILRALRDIARKSQRREEVAVALRRDGLEADRRTGADRDGLSFAVALGDRARPGQGDGDRPRRQKGRSDARPAAGCARRQRLDPAEADGICRGRRPGVVAGLSAAFAASPPSAF